MQTKFTLFIVLYTQEWSNEIPLRVNSFMLHISILLTNPNQQKLLGKKYALQFLNFRKMGKVDFPKST
jgi:hypothetical protein